MDISVELVGLRCVFMCIFNLNRLPLYALLCSLLLSFYYESCRFTKLMHIDLLYQSTIFYLSITYCWIVCRLSLWQTRLPWTTLSIFALCECPEITRNCNFYSFRSAWGFLFYHIPCQPLISLNFINANTWIIVLNVHFCDLGDIEQLVIYFWSPPTPGDCHFLQF